MEKEYSEILFELFGKKTYKAMINKMREEENAFNDELLEFNCELIYRAGISKAYRENVVEILEKKINTEEELEVFRKKVMKICKVYREYINIIIKFLVDRCNKAIKGEYLYTELAPEVAEFIIY